MGLDLDLVATDTASKNQLSKLADFLGKLNKQVQQFEEKSLREAMQLAQVPSDATLTERRMVEKLAQNSAKKKTAEFRRNLVDGTREERMKRLQPLADADVKAKRFAPLFQSPVQLLSMKGLGTEQLTHLQHQLSGAGPGQLETMRNLSLLRKDPVMGNAVVMALDQLPAKSRPFSAQALADEHVGDQFRAGRAAIAAIGESFQRGLNVNRKFESGRTDGTSKISLALAAKATK